MEPGVGCLTKTAERWPGASRSAKSWRSGATPTAVQGGDHPFVQEVSLDRGGDLLAGQAPEEERAVHQGQRGQLGVAGGGQLGQRLYLADGAGGGEKIAPHGGLSAGVRGVAQDETLVAVGQLGLARELGIGRAAVADASPAYV